MPDTIVAIHQPNFVPWLGYFQKIALADKFIFLDDAVSSKTTSYVNSVDLFVGSKKTKITVPITKPKSDCRLFEIKIFRNYIKKKFLKTVYLSYKKAPFYNSTMKLLGDLIDLNFENIIDFNMAFIEKTCCSANIEVRFYRSSDYPTEGAKAVRLINLCKELNADVYLSGLGASSYQNEKDFSNAGLDLQYIDYPNMQYQQYFKEEFIPNLSVLDFLMNHGTEGLRSQLLPMKQ
jgi:hypothetical protein